MFSRRRAPAGLVAASHRLGPRLVAGQRPPLEQLGEVVALTVVAGPIARQAGEPGFEPGFTVLETVRIAVNSLPRGELREQILGAAGYFFFFFFFAVTLNVVVFVDVLPAASRAVIVRR